MADKSSRLCGLTGLLSEPVFAAKVKGRNVHLKLLYKIIVQKLNRAAKELYEQKDQILNVLFKFCSQK